MEEHNKDTLKLKKSTLWKAGTVVFGMLFLVTIFHDVTDGGTSVNDNPIRANPTQQPTIPTGVASVNAQELTDDDPFLGDKNAPLTIIEFSDFQCPFCARFRQQTFDQIKTQYIDTGKVKFVYRDFPLTSIHSYAQKAAEAGECADDQNKFWEMHDKIFEGQSVWASSGVSVFKQYAQELGLDSKKFNDCLDSGKYKDEVEKDLNDATSSGGQGTPYFIIGNTPVSGAQPFNSFQAVIEAQL